MPEVLETPETTAGLREIQELEASELALLREALEEARREILARLAEARWERMAPINVRAALGQASIAIRALTRKATSNRRRALPRQFRTADRQVLEQIRRFQKDLRLPKSVQGDSIRKLARERGLLLQQYERSMATYGSQLIGEIQRRMVGHAVRHSTLREVQQDIAGRLQTSAFQRSVPRAELIVRTEMTDAWAVGHQESIRKAVSVVSGLQQQWHALDTACRICAPLNGRVRPVGKAFGSYRGVAIMRPTVHPRCDCRLIPWREGWLAQEG